MELEGQWWKGELAEDIYQALRYKVCMHFTVGRHIFMCKVHSQVNMRERCVVSGAQVACLQGPVPTAQSETIFRRSHCYSEQSFQAVPGGQTPGCLSSGSLHGPL